MENSTLHEAASKNFHVLMAHHAAEDAEALAQLLARLHRQANFQPEDPLPSDALIGERRAEAVLSDKNF